VKMGNNKRILRKKKDREKKVKLKLARRRESIRYDAKMEKEARAMDWEHREVIEPIRKTDKEKK